MRIPALITALALLGGSQLLGGTSSATNSNYSAQHTLAELRSRIVAADRVIVTNWAESGFGSPGVSISVSGDKVRKIVKAVSAAKVRGKQEHPDFEYSSELQFLNSTNLLAIVYFGEGDFLCDGVCSDDSGVLAELHKDLARREQYEKVYKDEDREFAATKKVEARQWLKDPSHLVAGMDKTKVSKFADAFYAAGATEVCFTDIEKKHNRNGKITERAKFMVVVVPQSPGVRRKVFVIHLRAVKAWGIDADGDVGQKYLWYESVD